MPASRPIPIEMRKHSCQVLTEKTWCFLTGEPCTHQKKEDCDEYQSYRAKRRAYDELGGNWNK